MDSEIRRRRWIIRRKLEHCKNADIATALRIDKRTAGTGVGTSMRVKEVKSNVRVVGVTPKLGSAIQGLRHPNEPFPPNSSDANGSMKSSK